MQIRIETGSRARRSLSPGIARKLAIASAQEGCPLAGVTGDTAPLALAIKDGQVGRGRALVSLNATALRLKGRRESGPRVNARFAILSPLRDR